MYLAAQGESETEGHPTLSFISSLHTNSRLEDSLLDEETLHRLRHPLTKAAMLTPDDRLSLKLYLNNAQGSDKMYEANHAAIVERNPDNNIPSLHSIQQMIAELTGVRAWVHDMCCDPCMAYTGPYSKYEECLHCKTPQPRYDPHILAQSGKKKPQCQFSTFPLGPQIQTRFRSHRMTAILEELVRTGGNLDRILDIYEGADFWDAVVSGHIGEDDVCLLFSMDDRHYKKIYILPGAIVPGPGKPKNPESFLYPGFQHIAALQREGLVIWDAARNVTFLSQPFVFLAGADAIGAPDMTGYQAGRCKPGGSHYYSVSLKPLHYSEYVSDASPEEYITDMRTLCGATSVMNYELRCLETGISKSSIFLGLHPRCTLPIPCLFPGDIMHLCGLNVTDLLLKLWRGLMECDTHNGDHKRSWEWVVLVGATWTKHGEMVAAAKHFLPGSFDCPPRNPAVKVSSGYKCWEFLTWFYGLAPALLYGVLPELYWRNFCMLVAGVRVAYQHETTCTQCEQAHRLLSDFVYTFEKLYIQRKVSRMHFAPQCLHSLPHMPLQTVHVGPLICSSQFTMECTIGDLGAEIKQPSKPFENLAQRSLHHAQDNALVAMYPELVAKPPCKTPSVDLGDGFILLHPCQKGPCAVEDREDIMILCYIEDLIRTSHAHSVWVEKMECCVQWWGCCHLPNGQICQTA
ncbi:hypothetical protein C8Q74DRAFT_1318877 [Fomes fomentarius]|nr:hypothetical protein C8Q74DRAFT_1318877 [Fomes fomentarius]